ncbi:zgc:171566 [Oncorhynchus masou masou]|uniref:zgc:171566 n=1 Tax=Oncorhynchus masou masou TaxID=90313 RepID=UPI003182DA64
MNEGVLAQENIVGDPHAQGSSYITASYVKYLESAGARVVPIRINRTDEEYEKIFNSINGLLLPGEGVDLQTSQFSRLSKIFCDLAIKVFLTHQNYFPIWDMCQGLQQMTVLTSNKNLLTPTETKAVALPLTFTPANHYPFYAVQWHPEKSPFEWVDKPGMVHSAASVRASFYTAHFFVSESDLF